MGIQKGRDKSMYYHIGDSLLCCFLFFPTMVFYWRGIWDLWGVYIYPGQYPKQPWILLAISSVSISGYFILPLLEKHRVNNITHHKNNTYKKVWFIIGTRTYFIIYASFYMCFWRAVWELADYYFPTDLTASLINLACTYVPLLLFRASRCCIFPPMFVTLDTRDDALIVSTRFSTKPYTIKYTLDCLFSHFILLSLTILSWRGMWNTLNTFIFPDNVTKSNFASLAIGYTLVLVIFLIEEPLAFVTLKLAKKGFYYKLIWEDFVYIIIFFCTAILWRGGWNLTAQYVIPDPEVGGWVCCIAGAIGLLLLQLFSYVSAHGIAIDGADEGRDAFFPTKYLRDYLSAANTQSYNTGTDGTGYTASAHNTHENGGIAIISATTTRDKQYTTSEIELTPQYSNRLSVYDNVPNFSG